MENFSEKSLIALGDYYVYGLIDPRNRKVFYIGKGSKNRVFEHEMESMNNPDSDKLKLKTIEEIKKAGLSVEKIIINSNLTEEEAFAAEASLINAFNYVEQTGLTNIVAGHHSQEALSVEDYEKINGAEELKKKDIKHRILVIKINKLYKRGMDPNELYDAVRGIWRINKTRAEEIEYVFGLYNSLIVAVYKPTKWVICKDDKNNQRPRLEKINDDNKDRKFFVDEGYEKGLDMDENEMFYLNKSVKNFEKLCKSQYPINYLYPDEESK